MQSPVYDVVIEDIDCLDECFSVHPETLLEEAVVIWCHRVKADAYALIFSRPNGIGYEFVAYECDADGEVSDWSKRFHIWNEASKNGLEKLHYGLVNGLFAPRYL